MRRQPSWQIGRSPSPIVISGLCINVADTSFRSYPVSKLLQLLAAREIAEKITNKEPRVIINTLNPGFCHSELARNATGTTLVRLKVMKYLLARTTEEGSRTLVHATVAGPESHGVFLHDCKLEK